MGRLKKGTPDAAGGLGRSSGPDGLLTPHLPSMLGGVGRRSHFADRRLVDGLRANSFTSLRSAAVHRTASVAEKCEQIKREIRPLMALRTNTGRYGPFPRDSAQGCGVLQALFFSAPFVQYWGAQEFQFCNRAARVVIS